MTEHSSKQELAIEEFREQLQTQLREDFFNQIQNDDDPSAEREQLVQVLTAAVDRLIKVEGSFVASILQHSEDGICPGCLISDTMDFTNIKAIANLVNHYIQSSNESTH